MTAFILLAIISSAMMIAGIIYIGIRLKAMLSELGLKVNKVIFWVILCALIVAISFLYNAGLAVLLYLLMFFILFDIFRLVLRLFTRRSNEGVKQKAQNVWKKLYQKGIVPVVLSQLLVVYGAANAVNVVVKEYDVEINKPLSEQLSIVMLSDIHIGTARDENDIYALCKRVNGLQADIIALCGDLYDELSTEAEKQSLYAALGKLSARLGVYYVHGNHDHEAEIENALAQYGIVTLNDASVLVNDAFYIAGRYDASMSLRSELQNIMKKIDTALPVILLDHQPKDLMLASTLDVDLQLSGHTHRGQLFPLNWAVPFANEMSYGYKQIGDYNIIVGAGTGTWGFAMRTAGQCEIVKVNVTGLPA